MITSAFRILAPLALLIMAFFMIDKRAEERGRLDQLVVQVQNRDLIRRIELTMSERLTEQNRLANEELRTQLSLISSLESTIITPTLVKEIRSETRFTDPATGISPGMLNALNSARRLTEPAAPE